MSELKRLKALLFETAWVNPYNSKVKRIRRAAYRLALELERPSDDGAHIPASPDVKFGKLLNDVQYLGLARGS